MLKSLDSFASAGTIPGTSMKGAAVRQPLTSASQEAMGLYMDHLTALGYSDATMRYAKQTAVYWMIGICIEVAGHRLEKNSGRFLKRAAA